ncbi:hypothetical protein K504DRAFT_531152 [Pleomassaria siparia CBS 279.74]|uniref:Uncharacterized protein n=1 Tax=Pleomassaria siparia CBS 279.74 TaxID=1314801 RepID=A0A6G1KGT7_9PLEO|nr:hypothetical protein K504DRAFT_531152 [Pleomassaria siparia CBS 279.74]
MSTAKSKKAKSNREKSSVSGGGTLVAVRAELAACSSPDAQIFVTLLESGNIAAARTENKATRERFGDAYPSMGKKTSPFFAAHKGDSWPTAEELRDMLLKDYRDIYDETEEGNDGEDVVHVHDADREECRDGGREKRAAVQEKTSRQRDAVQLLTNITSPTYTTRNLILSIPSPLLEESFGVAKEQGGHLLSSSDLSCTILPCNTYLRLQHFNEGTTVSTVLSGSIIHIIWPPTEGNLALLSQAYETYVVSCDPVAMDISQHLEGGIAMVQRPGEALRVSPFCPVLTLTTATTVLATYTTVPASSFYSILTRLPFLTHWWATELDSFLKRAAFGTALMACLVRIMDCEFETYTVKTVRQELDTPGPFFDLVKGWDGVKKGVLEILSKEQKAALQKKWQGLLIRSIGKNCLMCGHVCHTKSKEMPKHFMEAHWL